MCKYCENVREGMHHVSILGTGKGSFNDGDLKYKWNIHLTTYDPKGVFIGFGIEPEADKRYVFAKHALVPVRYCPFCGEKF